MARRPSSSSLWLRAAVAVAIGTGSYGLSNVLLDPDSLNAALFWMGPSAIVLSGSFGGWRGVVLSFAIPLMLVLVFPEHPDRPLQDPDTCDPFCAQDLVLIAGLGWAIAIGMVAAALALIGWGLGAFGRAVRADAPPSPEPEVL